MNRGYLHQRLITSVVFAMSSLACHAQFTISTSQANPTKPTWIVVNNAISFYALPSDGGPPPAGVTWTTAPSNVLKQTDVPNVFYAASLGGPVTITASIAGGATDTAVITVVPGIPQSFSITPLPATLAFRETASLSATGDYGMADGSTKSFPITGGVAWLPLPGANATIAAGVLTAGSTPGPVTVMASDPIFPPPHDIVGATVTIVASNPGTPQFNGPQTSGNQYVDILGKQGDLISVYQIDSGHAVASDLPCGPISLAYKTPLQIVNSSTNTSTVSTGLVGNGPNRLTLSAPLLAGTGLCLQALSPTGPWSNFINVIDPNDFGRVRTYMTVGMQITNQQPTAVAGTQTSTSSSTAGEYLEVGLVSDLRTAPERPDTFWKAFANATYNRGIQSVFDVRMSPIPVSAPALSNGTATTNGGMTTTTLTTTPTVSSLNLLTSQQSARVQTLLFFPSRMTTWESGFNFFTAAPIVKAGFTTLLNPSATSTSQGITTTANFSPTYNFFGYGGRIGWDQYPADPDKAPRMVTQLDVFVAKFSNLPSYLCTSNAANTAVSKIAGLTQGTNTACGTSALPNISRTLAYRLDIDGIAKLPGSPFVLGVTANLAQYTVGHNANIDYFNKPGNDIRVFIGVTLPLSSLGSLLTTGKTGN